MAMQLLARRSAPPLIRVAQPVRNYNNSLNPAWTAYVGSGTSTGKVENKFIAQVGRRRPSPLLITLLLRLLRPWGGAYQSPPQRPRA